jgi:hypothetical protein
MRELDELIDGFLKESEARRASRTKDVAPAPDDPGFGWLRSQLPSYFRRPDAHKAPNDEAA